MPADGRVNHAQWSGLVGWWLGIDFDNGWGADLMHNSRLTATPGKWYAAGTVIGYSGGTGSVATGPHVHWSLRPMHGYHLQNHGNVDPEKYLAGTAGGGGTPITERRKSMSTVYREADNMLHALAGDSPGTGANWLETNDPALASAWAAAHGGVVKVSADNFALFRNRYTMPVAISGGTSGGGSGTAPTADQNATATAAKLAPEFAKINDGIAKVPTATADELHRRTES